MIKTDMEFTPRSQADFAALLEEMSEVTGAEMPKVIRNTGRDFIRAAAPITPLARRLKESDFVAEGGYVVRVKHKSTGKMVSFIGTKAQFDEARKNGTMQRGPGKYPVGRGYARIGWWFALIQLGVKINIKLGTNSFGTKVSTVKATGDFVDGLNALSPFVEIVNRVPYIEKLDKGGPGMPPQHIMARGMAATAIKMEQTLTKLSQKMADNWNKR